MDSKMDSMMDSIFSTCFGRTLDLTRKAPLIEGQWQQLSHTDTQQHPTRE